MFALEKQAAVLSNFNPRRELHGDEPSPAGDLRFEVNLPSDQLALFAPTLRSLLYCKTGAGDLADQGHDAPNLRYPKLGPLSWDMEVIGAEVSIDYGLGGKSSDIVLQPVNINKFTIAPQEGGTCIVSFRVQGRPDERQAGKLCMLQGEKVTVTIVPPAADEDETDAPINTAGDESAPRRGRKRTPASNGATA